MHDLYAIHKLPWKFHAEAICFYEKIVTKYLLYLKYVVYAYKW